MGYTEAEGKPELGELIDEIKAIRLDDDSAFRGTLRRIRAYLELDNLLVFCPQERLRGWGIERIEADGFEDLARVIERVIGYLRQAPYRFWFFDPMYPESDQRDRVVDTIELVGNGTYRSSEVFREVIAPLRLVEHREVRVLVCNGSQVLAWIGAFQRTPLTPEQRERFGALLPALHRRLLAERAIRERDRDRATLSAALDRIAQPAFVVGASGDLLAMNHRGRDRLDRHRASVLRELDTARRGHVERHVLRGIETPTLLVVGPEAEDRRIEECIQRARRHWGLSTRQLEVLRLLARGDSEPTIANQLDISQRAVDLHLAVLLERAQARSVTTLVHSLLALVAT